MVHYLFATDEQREYADLARSILEKELAPRIDELEHADNGLGAYPKDIHKQMAEAGFAGMSVPEAWGGLELDVVSKAIICEEMAQVDAAFTFTFFNSTAFFPLIEQSSIPHEEKQRFADGIISGDIMGAFALTEADAGSDAGAMRTTAVKDGNEWVINGSKCFASSGPIADFYIVFAWTDKTQRASKGVTAFLVERERGVEVGKKECKLGFKLSETSDLSFNDVRVPEDHVIGELGTGFIKALNTINHEGRALGISFNLGLAQAALDHAIAYSKVRRQFGKRIIDHEGLGFKIADMQARTSASRAMMYYALEGIHHGKDLGTLNNELKMYVTDCTMQTALDAVQVLGGYGYMKDYPVEKYMRDAKIFQIFSGTNEIQKKNIARAIAGRDPEKRA